MSDTGETYQIIQELVALELGRIVRESFTLRLEKIYVVQRDRSLIDLCAELTGSVDDGLDTFILDNELTGSEIIEISRNRSIRYVV